MTLLPLNSRFLTGVNSSSQPVNSSNNNNNNNSNLHSDFVLILAALLCALICVLGLVAVARCAWIRRISLTSPPPPTPAASANKGLNKKVLNSLPKLTYSPRHGSFSVDCAICLAEFVSGDEIRLLPQCGHGFHVGCIDAWLRSHSSCPSCRVQILSTTRCQKCGELPSASSSAAAAGTPTTTRPRMEVQINRFLP